MVYPECMSVKVSVSIACTPGESARKSMRTDWHVEGNKGLRLTPKVSMLETASLGVMHTLSVLDFLMARHLKNHRPELPGEGR